MQKLLSLLTISYKNTHAYLGDVLGGNIVYALRISVIILLYKAIYKIHGSGASVGTSFEAIAWAMVIAQSIVMARRGDLHGKVTQEIRSGTIGVKLLLPISYPTNVSISYLVILFVNLGYSLIIGLTVGYFLIGSFPSDPRCFLAMLILIISGSLVSFYGYFMVALIGFFVEDSVALRWIYSKFDMIFGGNILPVVFLPNWMQSVAFFTPFPYAGYTAGLIFWGVFDASLFLKSLVYSVVWSAILFGICYAIFAIASKRMVTNGG